MKKIIIGLMTIGGICVLTPRVNAEADIQIQPIQTTIPQNGVRVPIANIIINTQQSPIEIKEIAIQRTGLSHFSEVESVRAYTKNKRTRPTPMLSDDIARIRFIPNLQIPPNTQETITITANLQLQNSFRTIGFDVINIISNAAPETQKTTPQTISKKTKQTIHKKRFVNIAQYRGSRRLIPRR